MLNTLEILKSCRVGGLELLPKLCFPSAFVIPCVSGLWAMEVGPVKDGRDLAFLPQVSHAIESGLSEK